MVSSPLGGGGEDGKQKHYFPQQVLLVGDGKWGWGWGSLGRDGMRCYVLVWRSNKLSQNPRNFLGDSGQCTTHTNVQTSARYVKNLINKALAGLVACVRQTIMTIIMAACIPIRKYVGGGGKGGRSIALHYRCRFRVAGIKHFVLFASACVFIPRSKPTPTQPKSSQGESLFASTQKVTTS
jgi:hypothetical protein